MTYEAILSEALALPEDERAALAKRLAETLASDTSSDSDQAWVAEINRRLEDIESGRVQTISSDAMMARVRAKLNVKAG
jgi:putative addiction module component (TIGR02574 family)